MAETLYRKYRPKTFAEVTEQEHIKQTIGQEIKSGRLAHAFLFSGPRGVGKTTLARLIAKAVNCLKRTDAIEPCNTCPACTEIEQNRSLDIIEIDAASQTGVDQVRENIIASAKVATAIRKYKVFIVDEVHMLSMAAFNALLKTLEEPPKNVLFILATTEIHKVPVTIISRCQRFDFHKIKSQALFERLQYIVTQEGFMVSDDVLQRVVKYSQGYLRDALSLLGQILSLGHQKIGADEASIVMPASNFSQVFQLTELVSQKKAKEAILLLDKIVEGGTDLQQFANEWVEFTRQVLLAKINNDWAGMAGLSSPEQAESIKSALAGLTVNDLLKLLAVVLSQKPAIKTAEIQSLPLELAIATYCFS